MFRGFDAKIGSGVHSYRHGYGQKLVLSSGVGKNNGARLLRASSKARGRLGALVLPSMDTFVSFARYKTVDLAILPLLLYIFSPCSLCRCLKREFPTEIALVMWEACWVNYLTDHFHLFLCLAIMCVYADDVIAQDLRTDEMLLHFSSLAMYMDGNVILRKARGLLHHFRQLVRLPCTLAGLCRQCGPGMWDSTHDPVIECVGHEDTNCVCCVCPYLNNYE